MLGGILRSRCTLSTAVIAVPSATVGARLKEMVTEGNWLWRLIESGDCVRSKRVKALSGTAFAELELLVTLEVVVPFAPTPVLIALLGGMRTPEEGVYFTGVVSALEPAADDPVAANDEVAPGPLAPEDVFA